MNKMKIKARFSDKAPAHIADIERLTITIGEFEVEIVAVSDFPSGQVKGLSIRLDGPLGETLAAFPRASNTLVLSPRRL